MNKALLTVSDLSVHFGTEAVLDGVGFTVNEHDVVVIVGPNGAGKSTLLKALLNLVPYQGTIHWNTKKIGYLPPQESLLRKQLPPLTVRDFFLFKSSSEQTYLEMLQEVGLPTSIFNQSIATLSTGQFQRMMLAWVLLDHPSALLLDEPTAGIDIGGQETIYSLLHTLWKKWNLTLLLVTHDIGFMWKHATTVLCLNKKLICYGPPEQTLTPEMVKQLYGTKVSLYEHRHPSSD